MAWFRVGLSIAGTLALMHALGCGGTTRNPGAGAGEAGAGAGAASSGAGGGDAGMGAQSSGGSSLLPDMCIPMDAQSDGTRCADIAGYTWLGELCQPVYCGCAGSDCERLFPTMAACDRAYQACYARTGLQQSCGAHAECGLVSRTCCPACGEAGADDQLSLNVESKSLFEAGLCDALQGCPDCVSLPNPLLYAACIDTQCTVVDVGEQAACETDDDCRLTSKDCCDCGGDFGPDGVMAVGRGYSKPEHCAGVACDECLPSDPPGLFARCDPDRSVCVVDVVEP